MQRESQKDRTILCKYEPTEPGDYRIEVRHSVPEEPECERVNLESLRGHQRARV